MAALIKHATGIEPQLAEGRLGEFAVRVNGEAVARRSWLLKLPPDERVLAAVRAALRR